MKTPPIQYTDDQARQLVEEFIGGGQEHRNGNGVEVAVSTNGYHPVEVAS
jgi:hypothetical protein